jgi:hypothetical protein
MTVKRIELEGRAGHVAIEREGGNIRIDSIIRNPGKEQAWLTRVVAAKQLVHADASENELWSLAQVIQRRCDGVRGTNGDIDGYFRELQRFAD